MRPRMASSVVLCGPRRPETVLVAMENFISWEALRLAWEAPGQADSQLWQGLEQEALLFVHRLLLSDPDIWVRKLERLTSLAMQRITAWPLGVPCRSRIAAATVSPGATDPG